MTEKFGHILFFYSPVSYLTTILVYIQNEGGILSLQIRIELSLNKSLSPILPLLKF